MGLNRTWVGTQFCGSDEFSAELAYFVPHKFWWHKNKRERRKKFRKQTKFWLAKKRPNNAYKCFSPQKWRQQQRKKTYDDDQMTTKIKERKFVQKNKLFFPFSAKTFFFCANFSSSLFIRACCCIFDSSHSTKIYHNNSSSNSSMGHFHNSLL